MNTKRLLIYTLLIFIVCSSNECKKEKGDPLSQLPPATQNGANTFGCLVNGQVFVPKAKIGNINPTYQCYYQYLNADTIKGYFFNVSANNSIEECNYKAVTIQTSNLPIQNNETIDLRSLKSQSAEGTYSILSCGLINDYNTSDFYKGQLFITKFDEVNDIVSGTFWFTAVNTSGDTVKITDGRFDMKFTR